MVDSAELVDVFKALADTNRLKIVGLLAQKAYSVEELAALLELKPSTVSHHLSKLHRVGLVSARAEGYYSVYQLNEKALEATTQRIFSSAHTATVLEDIDLNAYDRKVVGDYTNDKGKLSIIPAQRKKLEAILRYVARAFQPGVRYSEKQVNEILSTFHEDTATLRRELVGARLMEREGGGGEYWLAEKQTGKTDE